MAPLASPRRPRPASFRAKGARNVYIANLLLWGPGFFTSSALTMARVVERLLESLYEPTT